MKIDQLETSCCNGRIVLVLGSSSRDRKKKNENILERVVVGMGSGSGFEVFFKVFSISEIIR